MYGAHFPYRGWWYVTTLGKAMGLAAACVTCHTAIQLLLYTAVAHHTAAAAAAAADGGLLRR